LEESSARYLQGPYLFWTSPDLLPARVRKRSLLGIEREPQLVEALVEHCYHGLNGVVRRGPSWGHIPKNLLVGAGWPTVGKLREAVDAVAPGDQHIDRDSTPPLVDEEVKAGTQVERFSSRGGAEILLLRL
jgi:hypothetical protein